MNNFWRQLDVFDPSKFDKKIQIIGCGAIGSHICETLIKTGIKNIKVHDFDAVEDHNLPNQAFNNSHLGMLKVEAMSDIAANLGVEIETSSEPTEGLVINEPSYVMLAVDKMSVRKSVFDSIKFNSNVRLFETRMAAEYGYIHAIDPINPIDIEFWESNWFPDEEAEESACTNRAIATTAKVLSAVNVHSLIMWEAGQKPPKQMMICLRPFLVHTNQ